MPVTLGMQARPRCVGLTQCWARGTLPCVQIAPATPASPRGPPHSASARSAAPAAPRLWHPQRSDDYSQRRPQQGIGLWRQGLTRCCIFAHVLVHTSEWHLRLIVVAADRCTVKSTLIMLLNAQIYIVGGDSQIQTVHRKVHDGPFGGILRIHRP